MDLIHRSRLTGNVLMINQTDQDKEFEFQENGRRLHIINTTQRGLSNSRNMAIERADGDICLLCDDDEEFEPDYETTILNAFDRLPSADVIAFRVRGQDTRLKQRMQKIGYFKSLRLVSYQLAFRREQILRFGIRFDPHMGAGSGNGACEENKFLLDCLKKELRIWYMPETIARVNHGPSTWFSGYNQAFFIQRGSATRHMMGLIPSIFSCKIVIQKKLFGNIAICQRNSS